MKKLATLIAALVLSLSVVAPAAAHDRFWVPEDGRVGVAGPWYSPTSTWLDPLRCDAWQAYTATIGPAATFIVLRAHGWTGTLRQYQKLSRAEQCAWALTH